MKVGSDWPESSQNFFTHLSNAFDFFWPSTNYKKIYVGETASKFIVRREREEMWYLGGHDGIVIHVVLIYVQHRGQLEKDGAQIGVIIGHASQDIIPICCFFLQETEVKYL